MSLRQNKSVLAAAIASAVSLLSSGAWAADLHVTNCQNSGSHSLRATIASAADTGDRIVFDATMNCSTITLTTGELKIVSKDLTLQGPTQSTLVIDGNHSGRVINAVKATTDNKIDLTTKLTINDLTLRNGYATGVVLPTSYVLGGCVAAGGDLILNSSTVTGCTAKNTSGAAMGGGIFASGLHMNNSQVINNVVSADSTSGTGSSAPASGGGVAAHGGLDTIIASSEISGNTTMATGPHSRGLGGGIYFNQLHFPHNATISITGTSVLGNHADSGGGAYLSTNSNYNSSNFSIDRSTFSANSAGYASGASIYGPLSTLTMTNSTVSSNSATNVVGGISAYTASSKFVNDTIAFNVATNKTYSSPYGEYVRAAGLDGASVLTNTIIARNTAASEEWDFNNIGVAVTGSNNLVMLATPSTPVPTGTLTADPLLTALANNGGPTLTHALNTGSPSIDAGCNSAPTTDQRGPGFPRQFGPAVDIGAYEYGDSGNDDVIFRDGFDRKPCAP